MIKFFEKCPACGGTLIITECRCQDCDLQLRGNFQPPEFSGLSEDQLTFVRIFLRSRGNLSEVEKVLGVSYPTIRNKLDEINKVLDEAEATAAANRAKAEQAPAEPDPVQAARQAILQQVAAGQLSAAQAIEKLQELQGGK